MGLSYPTDEIQIITARYKNRNNSENSTDIINENGALRFSAMF
jgi:hypothetical protein